MQVKINTDVVNKKIPKTSSNFPTVSIVGNPLEPPKYPTLSNKENSKIPRLENFKYLI